MPKKKRKSSRKLNAARIRRRAKQVPTPPSRNFSIRPNRAARRIIAAVTRKKAS